MAKMGERRFAHWLRLHRIAPTNNSTTLEILRQKPMPESIDDFNLGRRRRPGSLFERLSLTFRFGRLDKTQTADYLSN